ncbi:MAG: DUF3311 domain-containing protein [Planctomycetes bacterium]|nr:DUF3311 domain-containing protein [Planctomycetota bacterium]
MKRFVTLLVLALIVLHQDFWHWDRIEPLVLGFLPIGLAYHAGLSIAAAVVWALAVRYCWPRDVDVAEDLWAGQAAGKHREL